MKSKKLLITSILAACVAGSLAGCSNNNVITIWVGEESTEFYQKVCDQYVADHPDFGYSVKVTGTDTGSNGGAMSDDNTKCGDIITIAHDNIGKLVEKNKILPFSDEGVINQVNADNQESFKSVVFYENDIGAGKQKYLYGVPYISQALFLYYNKQYVTAEQAKTFEGLMAAAKSKGSSVKAFSVDGTDGYNYSFNLLARTADDNTTSLKLYESFGKKNCWAQGEDEVASLKWAQRVFNDPNGGLFPTDSGWTTTFKNGGVVSVIAGAWRYDAASSIGKSNLGITVLPTYTFTADDVQGTDMAEGTKMQAGTFADCKVFTLNAKDPSKVEKSQELIKYLSTKSMQLQSFVECKNVPSYKNCEADLESVSSQVDKTVLDLAKAQLGMNKYAIPQPFISGTLNTYYYSKKAPEAYKDCVLNEDGTKGTTRAVRETLYTMQHIWMKGKNPTEIPAVLPAEISQLTNKYIYTEERRNI